MTQDEFKAAQALIDGIKLFEKQRDKIASINPYKAIIGERNEDVEIGIPLDIFNKVQEVITDYFNNEIDKMQKKFELL